MALIGILPVGPTSPPTAQPAAQQPIGVSGTGVLSSGGQTLPPPCGSNVNSLIMGTNTVCNTTIVPALSFNDTDFYEGAISDGIITVYITETDYFWDEHVLQMPVMSTEVATASFANLANETLKRVCYWKAEKANVPPMMPDPDLNGDNSVLLEKKFTPMSIDLAADGVTKIFTLKGMYVYGIKDPTQENMYYGIPPYIDDNYSATAFGTYQHGIIDSLS